MKIKFFIGVLVVYLIGGDIYAYDSDALAAIESRSTTCLQHRDLSGASLNWRSLWHFDFSYSDLSSTGLREAELPYADLSYSNLSHADLSHSFLVRIKLYKTKVQGANFHGAIGLTNARKKYLREHGAINVPEDRPEDENEMDATLKLGPVITVPLNVSKKALSFIFLTVPKHVCKKIINIFYANQEA